MVSEGQPRAVVANELGISNVSLGRWLAQAAESGVNIPPPPLGFEGKKPKYFSAGSRGASEVKGVQAPTPPGVVNLTGDEFLESVPEFDFTEENLRRAAMEMFRMVQGIAKSQACPVDVRVKAAEAVMDRGGMPKGLIAKAANKALADTGHEVDISELSDEEAKQLEQLLSKAAK